MVNSTKYVNKTVSTHELNVMFYPLWLSGLLGSYYTWMAAEETKTVMVQYINFLLEIYDKKKLLNEITVKIGQQSFQKINQTVSILQSCQVEATDQFYFPLFDTPDGFFLQIKLMYQSLYHYFYLRPQYKIPSYPKTSQCLNRISMKRRQNSYLRS